MMDPHELLTKYVQAHGGTARVILHARPADVEMGEPEGGPAHISATLERRDYTAEDWRQVATLLLTEDGFVTAVQPEWEVRAAMGLVDAAGGYLR